MRSYGERLRRARRERGWRQKDVAERIGAPRRSVSNWELGDATPRQESERKLAELLGVERQTDEAPDLEHDHDIYVVDGSIWLTPDDGGAVYACHDCGREWETPMEAEKLASVACESEAEVAA